MEPEFHHDAWTVRRTKQATKSYVFSILETGFPVPSMILSHCPYNIYVRVLVGTRGSRFTSLCLCVVHVRDVTVTRNGRCAGTTRVVNCLLGRPMDPFIGDVATSYEEHPEFHLANVRRGSQRLAPSTFNGFPRSHARRSRSHAERLVIPENLLSWLAEFYQHVHGCSQPCSHGSQFTRPRHPNGLGHSSMESGSAIARGGSASWRMRRHSLSSPAR